jgi:hypothetical protein
MCYNGYMSSGGKRDGAGRPPKLAKQLELAEKLAKQLQGALGLGLDKLGQAFPDLVQASIEEALRGPTAVIRSQERRFLISKMIDLVKMEEGKDTPLGSLALSWIKEVKIDVNMAGQGDGHNPALDRPGRGEALHVIEGTARSIPS